MAPPIHFLISLRDVFEAFSGLGDRALRKSHNRIYDFKESAHGHHPEGEFVEQLLAHGTAHRISAV